MPFRRAALAWFGDFLDWEDEHGGRRLGVSYPSPKHIGAATSLILAFWGGSAVLGGGDGGGVEPAPPPPSYEAPNTPTADVVVFAPTGDSARVVGTTFVGSLDDTHDSTQIQVDTAGGTFASPQYHNVSLGAVLTDTVLLTGDSGAVAKARMRYKGAEGGWSAWSDTVQFVASSTVESLDFYSSWDAGNNLDGGVWEYFTVDSQYMDVVAATGLDMPAGITNVLRIEVPDHRPNPCCPAVQISVTDAWPMPGIGEAAFYRVWFRNHFPVGFSMPNLHFLHLGHYSGTAYESTFWWQPDESAGAVASNGAHRLQFKPDWQTATTTENAWHNHYIFSDSTYRLEYKILRVDTNELRYSTRLYGPDGTLRNSSPSQIFFEYYGAEPWTRIEDFEMFVGNAASVIRVVELGYNGSNPSGVFSPTPYMHFAGFAVRVSADTTAWIGDYIP